MQRRRQGVYDFDKHYKLDDLKMHFSNENELLHLTSAVIVGGCQPFSLRQKSSGDAAFAKENGRKNQIEKDQNLKLFQETLERCRDVK